MCFLAHTHTLSRGKLWANSVPGTHVTASFLCEGERGFKGRGRGNGRGREGKAEREGWSSGVGAERRRSSSFGTTAGGEFVLTHEKKGERQRKGDGWTEET